MVWRSMLTALSVTLLFADGCEPRGTSDDDDGLCILGCNPCSTDHDCAADELCVGNLFGAICDTPAPRRLCTSNSQCASHEACRVRDKDCFLCTDPGPSRRTCEDRMCTRDEDCGEGNACYMRLFSEHQYCSPRIEVEDAAAHDDASDGASADSEG